MIAATNRNHLRESHLLVGQTAATAENVVIMRMQHMLRWCVLLFVPNRECTMVRGQVTFHDLR